MNDVKGTEGKPSEFPILTDRTEHIKFPYESWDIKGDNNLNMSTSELITIPNIGYDNVDKNDFEEFMRLSYQEGKEKIVQPKSAIESGKPHKWVFDNRVPFSYTKHLRTACNFFIDILKDTGIRQIATNGIAGAMLGGGITAYAPFDINLGVTRPRKNRNLGKDLEGSIHPSASVLIIDDILNRGNSSFKKPFEILQKYNFMSLSFASLMYYDWNEGKDLVQEHMTFYYGMRISKLNHKTKQKSILRSNSTHTSHRQKYLMTGNRSEADYNRNRNKNKSAPNSPQPNPGWVLDNKNSKEDDEANRR